MSPLWGENSLRLCISTNILPLRGWYVKTNNLEITMPQRGKIFKEKELTKKVFNPVRGYMLKTFSH
jgi:hypothetical protein